MRWITDSLLLALLVLVSIAPRSSAQEPRVSLGERLRRTSLTEISRSELRGGLASTLGFSRTERLLACGAESGEVVVYDLTDLAKPLALANILASPERISHVTFGLDDAVLVVLAADLQVWDWRAKRLLWRTPACDGSAFLCTTPIAIDPSGTRVACSPRRGEAAILDLSDGSTIQRTDVDLTSNIETLVFSPDAAQLWILSRGFESRLWDLNEASVTRPNSGDLQPSSLAIADDGTRIVGDWRAVLAIGEHRIEMANSQRGVAVSRDGATVVAQLPGRELHVFDGDGTLRHVLPTEGVDARTRRGGGDSCFALSASGVLLAIGGRDGVIRMFHGQQQIATIEADGPIASANSVAFAPGGDLLAASDGRRTLVIDLDDCSSTTLEDGGVIAAGPTDASVYQAVGGELRVLDLATKRSEIIGSLTSNELPLLVEEVRAISTSPRGKSVIADLGGGLLGSAIVRFDGPTHDREVLEQVSRLHDAAWTSDGSRLFVASELARFCGNAPRIGKLTEWRDGSRYEFDIGSTPPHSLDVSLDDAHLYWSERTRLHEVSLGTAGARRSVEANVRWFRCVDQSLGVSHDGSSIRLWDLRALKPLRAFRPNHLPRVATEPDPFLVMFEGEGALPSDLNCAALSPDRRRIAVATMHHVVVYEISRR